MGIRARGHPSYWAFVLHRVSGIALAAFLPLHFWALGQALRGEAALDGFLRFAEAPAVKVAEWGLVVLLAAHLDRRAAHPGDRVPAVERACARTGSPQRSALASPAASRSRWRWSDESNLDEETCGWIACNVQDDKPLPPC